MRKFVYLFLAMALLATAAGGALAADYPSKNFECIAPAGPGGGWDTTMRMAAKVLTEKGIIKTAMPVVNKPGGGGGVALTYLQRKKSNPYSLVVYSPPLILINLTGQSKLGYKDITPISMLINDFGAFAVPKNSPYNTIDELFAAMKKNPKSIKIGGTSSQGSMDHVQFMVAAKAAGIADLSALQYIAFQGGEGLASLMGAHIDVLSTGMAELVGVKESGDVKVLAVTAPKRIPTGPLADVPTLRERGIDAEYINWRGIFGAPGMPEAERKFMENAFKQMTETAEWKEICSRNGWVESYMNAADFGKFLDKVNEDNKTVLADLGLLQ